MRLFFVLVLNTLNIICLASNHLYCNRSRTIFPNPSIYSLLVDYQAINDSVFSNEEKEYFYGRDTLTHFSLDFYLHNRKIYVLVIGTKDDVVIPIQPDSNEMDKISSSCYGYSNLGFYDIIVYNHAKKKNSIICKYIKDITISNDQIKIDSLLHLNGSIIFDPYKVLYKLNVDGTFERLENGYSLKMLKRIANYE